MTALSVRDLSVSLGKRRVLEGVRFDMADGELVALVGPNGAGKTTLLRAALGLTAATGDVLLDGHSIADMTPAERASRVGYLPQERRLAWGLPALEVAALGAPLASAPEARARGLETLGLFGVDHLAKRSVFELSGGERAKVLLARLFATRANMLVADEPVAGLDPDAQLLCLDRLKQHARAGGAVLTTLHDLGLAARYADRVLVLHEGRIVADDAPEKALSPRRLKEAFGVRARWIDAGSERLLHLDRA